MDKTQAYYALWSRFGIPAYDEQSVPDDAELPYITYEVVLDDYDNGIITTASLWYRGTSWAEIDEKLNAITDVISVISPLPIDGGFMYVTKASPWCQRMADETDRTIKRYLLNVGVNFLTNN